MAVRCSPASRAVLWVVCCAAVASAAQTLEVRRSSQSLAATPTHLQPADAAPLTQLQPHVTHGGLVPRETETRLQAAAGPATLLRAAEVPPQRLEQTRALLVELQAQPTPEQAISIDLPADVLFDFDKAELRADAARSLDKAAELLKSYPKRPSTWWDTQTARGAMPTTTPCRSAAPPPLPPRCSRARGGRSPRAAWANASLSRPIPRRMGGTIPMGASATGACRS